MRIPAAVLAIVMLSAGPALAQGLEKGVRGGVNFTNTSASGGDEAAALDWQLRGVFGGFVTWRVASWLEFQPEVMYAQKGAKSTEFDIESKLLLDYLEVPLLARKTFGAPDATRLYVAGGPSIGVLLRARTRSDFGSSTEELDIKDDVETLDFGLVVGGGVEFGSIVVDGRYTHGLSDIDKDTSDDVKLTNRAISVTVGIKF
jgi:hypothetical protein